METTILVIISASLISGLLAGWVMHRSDFCVTAMFRDAFLFRDTFLLRIWVVLLVASITLFEVGRLVGVLAPYPFPLLGLATPASALAGMIFGVGMVLAGGCVVGTLYKLGAGSLAALVALIGMLTGSALYAEMHGPWSTLSRATVLHPKAITLGQWLELPPWLLIAPLAGLGAYQLWRWQRAGLLQRISHSVGHLAPWRAALILAGIGFFSYLAIGMPLGITTSYAKLGSTVEAWLWPDHVAGLAYFSAQPLSYQPPFSNLTVTGGPGPALDGVAAIQYPLIVGMILGGFLSARAIGEFHPRFSVPRRQLISALVGGVLLGLSARMVPGCNIWHLWGGIPILALQSLLFLAGLVPGAWLGSRLLTRFVIR